jgi:superfamily I DNA/RNA helicase
VSQLDLEILATTRFLDRARADPELAARAVRRLAAAESGPPSPPGSPAPHPSADLVGPGRVVGWSRDRRQLALHFLEDTPRRAPAAFPPLAAVGLVELREMGVPEDRVGAVQRARTLEELDGLSLPAGVAGRVRFRFIQESHGGAATAPPLERRARNVKHLEDYLRGSLTQLLLNLDASQRQIVELSGSGAIVAKGVAGSGKTSIILHRIHQLLEGTPLIPPSILLLTFNRALRKAAQELLHAMGIRGTTLEISTLHAWCMRFLGPLRPARVAGERERKRLLERAKEAASEEIGKDSALWGYPAEFWKDELHLIKGRVLGGREEYLSMDRVGAGRPLQPHLRAHVWRVTELFDRMLEESGQADWDDVVRRAHRRLAELGDAAPRYDHVFVDEAQDLTPLALRVAGALAGKQQNVVVCYDPAQSLHERGFRWKQSGLTVHPGRSFTLRRNYRNTAEIFSSARPVMEALRGGADEEERLVSPEEPTRRGPLPVFLPTGPGEEAAAIAASVRYLIAEERVPPQNIAALSFTRALRDRIHEELIRAGVRAQKHDEDEAWISLADPSVKVLTLLSAKGLEFPVVYLAASAHLFAPPASVGMGEEREAWLERMRRCLYVGMTRAMTRLVLVHERGQLVPLLWPG